MYIWCVAQLVEQGTFNPQVASSNLAAPTTRVGYRVVKDTSLLSWRRNAYLGSNPSRPTTLHVVNV
jgi:hypothetical protein